jgi:hypothetical protein
MPFVRILLVIVALMGFVIAGLAFFRSGPDAAPPPVADTAPAAPRPTPVAAPRNSQPREVLSPADASSPAEITAREAEEAQRRLEKEQEESVMMVPDMDPLEMMPPDVAPPVKP